MDDAIKKSEFRPHEIKLLSAINKTFPDLVWDVFYAYKERVEQLKAINVSGISRSQRK